MFVKAGGQNPLMLPECQKALAACGYSPDDFGSYNDVLDRCGQARKKTGGAATTPGDAPPQDPEHNPTAHEAWLATCESGHMAENTRQQQRRGRNQTSYCPLYEWQHAPCMPHSGKAGWRDTQHGAVTATDVATSNAQGQGNRMGAEEERAATRRATEAALDWGMNDQPAAEQLRAKRFAAIAELNAEDKDIAAAKAQGDAKLKQAIQKKHQEQEKTAAACVEGFFEYQWRKMANNTKDKKKKAADSAAAKKQAAEQSLARARASGNPEEVRRAEAELRKASDEHAAANADWNRVKDLDPNDTDACLGQSRGARARSPSSRNAPPASPPPSDESV